MKYINKKKAFELVAKGAMLVDMRSPVAFRDGSINGSTNLPLRNFLNKLPTISRSQKVVIFGETMVDTDLKTAYNYAEQLGFTNVFITEYKQLAAD